MTKKFIVEFVSDLDYEDMVADISYEEAENTHRTVAMVTQQQGPNGMEIEIFSPKICPTFWNLSLDDFLKAIQFAKQSLIEMKGSSGGGPRI